MAERSVAYLDVNFVNIVTVGVMLLLWTGLVAIVFWLYNNATGGSPGGVAGAAGAATGQ